jgi:hypothetical protein
MSSKAVIETPQFAEEKVRVGLEVPRLDEILRGITWALQRDPRRFPQVRGTRLHRILTDPFPDAPPVRVWYTYSILQQEVHLLSIERMDGEETAGLGALQLASFSAGHTAHVDPDPAA